MNRINLSLKNNGFILFFTLWCLFFLGRTDGHASWTSGGPPGGQVNSLAISSNPDIIYAGTNRGIYKSIDAGTTWSKTSFPNTNVRVVMVAPAGQSLDINVDPAKSQTGPPDIAWVGLDTGIFKSTDGGNTWNFKGFNNTRINAIATHPADPDNIFVGTGWPDQDGDTVGIYQSTNGGDDWTLRYSSDLDAVAALIFDAENHDYLYAGVYRGNYETGFLKSIDGGQNWQKKQIGPFTASKQPVVALAMHPNVGPYPDTLYAIRSGHSVNNDVFKSVDKGETWKATEAPYIALSPPWALAIDPNQPWIVYACSTFFQGRLFQYAYGTWSIKANGLPSITPTSLVIDPRSSHIYAGLAPGGIYKSVDEADNWQMSSQGLIMTGINALAIDSSAPDTAYATVAGSGYHLAKTTNGGISWQYPPNSPTELDAVTVDPQAPAVIYVGEAFRYRSSVHVYKSTDGGQNWNVTRLFALKSSAELGVKDIWVKPDDPDIIVVAVKGGTDDEGTHGGGIYRSANGGDSYQRVYPTLGIMWATSLASHPSNPQILYCGTTGKGYIYKSTSAGQAWSMFSPAGDWVGGVRDVEVDQQGHVYAASNEGLLKWNGFAWSRLSGLPTDDITSLALDHSKFPSSVYAATDGNGNYVSEDLGNTWLPYVEGLGDFNIQALAIAHSGSKNMIYTGTISRGAWSRPIPEYTQGNILLHQPISGSNTTALGSQDFELPSDAYDNFLADDFTNSESWEILTIFMPGRLFAGGRTLMNARTLHFKIYADAAGIPDGDPSGRGNPPVWQLSATPSDSRISLSNGILDSLPSDVMLNLPNPLILAPGTYWLVFYAEMDYTPYGQYGRNLSVTANGYDAMVINPGGGFNLPTAWTSIRESSTWNLTEQDLAFQLVGRVATCQCDFDEDGDVDGPDLYTYITGSSGIAVQTIADELGRNGCPHD